MTVNLERAATARRVTILKSGIVFRQGELAKYWYEISSGFVRLCHYFGDGRRQVAHFPVAGEVFGLEFGSRQFFADALTDLEVIRHDLIDGWSLPAAVAGGNHARAVQQALDAAERNLRFFGQPNACRRIAAFLLDFRNRSNTGDQIYLPMSRQDIADHLGLTMHTVSRSVSQLVKLGLLVAKSPSMLRVTNPAAFEDFAGEAWIDPGFRSRMVA